MAVWGILVGHTDKKQDVQKCKLAFSQNSLYVATAYNVFKFICLCNPQATGMLDTSQRTTNYPLPENIFMAYSFIISSGPLKYKQ